MYTSQSIFALALLALSPLVSAHGKITSATGDLGGKGQGLGVVAGQDQSQADVTVFQNGVFGSTQTDGAIDPNTDIAAMIAQTGATIPQVAATGGVVTMVFHQINGDGAGPVACSVSADATGKTFTAMKVTTDVPGTNGRSNAANADFPLVASMPAGTTCTGTVGGLKNVCIVKCANPAGPFGGNVPVQMAGGASAVEVAATTSAAAVAVAAATSATAVVVDTPAVVDTSTAVASSTVAATTSAAAVAAATSAAAVVVDTPTASNATISDSTVSNSTTSSNTTTSAGGKSTKKGKKGGKKGAKKPTKLTAATGLAKAKANAKRAMEWSG